MNKPVKFTDNPKYSLMPAGFEWHQFTRAYMTRDLIHGKSIGVTNQEAYLRKETQQHSPTFGILLQPEQETQVGTIRARKIQIFLGNVEIEKPNQTFHIKQYKDSGVGIGQFRDGQKSFVFPLDEVLMSLFRVRIGVNSTVFYTSWAEINNGKVRIISVPSVRQKNNNYEDLINKEIDPDKALTMVVQKTILEILAQDLLELPIKVEKKQGKQGVVIV